MVFIYSPKYLILRGVLAEPFFKKCEHIFTSKKVVEPAGTDSDMDLDSDTDTDIETEE